MVRGRKHVIGENAYVHTEHMLSSSDKRERETSRTTMKRIKVHGIRRSFKM